MKLKFLTAVLMLAACGSRAQISNVIQADISGNAPASALGSPFGQSFIPTSLDALVGVGLAVVNDTGVGDITVSLFHADASGTTLLGNAITSGTITAAQIESFYNPVATPLWFPVYFDQPYAQTPGENLAFTIQGSTLNFYFAAGTAYPGGQLLGDGTKDLTFATLVPEPGMGCLMSVCGCCVIFGRAAQRMVRVRRISPHRD